MIMYRVGIVGLSGIAAAPAVPGPVDIFGSEMPHSHAAGYAAVSTTQVVAVCDLLPRLLGEFKERWSATWGAITTYVDYREMLAREKLDILSVVTPDNRHANIVVEAVAAGIKGILCEKPIATSLADADRMIQAVEQAGVPMIINHTRRWLPEFHQARQIIRNGEIGRLSRIVACLGGPRAMLFRNGTHLLDMVNFFAESAPQWVMAELDPGFAGYGPVYAGDGGHDPATDPGATAMIRYQNGVIALFCCSKLTPLGFRLDLLGENGHLRMESGVTEIETAPAGSSPVVRRLTCPPYMYSNIVAAIRELISLIEKGGEGQCPPREARKALEIILAILRSQHLGNTRVDLPLQE